MANNGADASPLRTLSRSRRANQRRGVHDTVQPTTWRGCSGVSARVVSPATAAATQRFRHAMPAVRYHTTPHPSRMHSLRTNNENGREDAVLQHELRAARRRSVSHARVNLCNP